MTEATITDIMKVTGYAKDGRPVTKTRISFDYKGRSFYLYMDGDPTNEEIAKAVSEYVKTHLGLLDETIKV